MTREHEALEHLTGHDGWGLVRARILDLVRIYYEQLLIPSQKRKDTVPDDFIRGAIAALREIVEWPDAEVQAAHAQEEEEALRDMESHNVVPLFGNGRPIPEGEGHGRPEDGSTAS